MLKIKDKDGKVLYEVSDEATEPKVLGYIHDELCSVARNLPPGSPGCSENCKGEKE